MYSRYREMGRKCSNRKRHKGWTREYEDGTRKKEYKKKSFYK